MCLAGWWAGIGYANVRSKNPKKFDEIYPDILNPKPRYPNKVRYEDWEKQCRAKGFVPREELHLL